MKIYTDQQMEISIANMLRVGVTLSAIILAAGGILYLLPDLTHGSKRLPDYSHFNAQSASLRTVSGIFNGVAHLDSRSIIELGILLLVATPIMRVVFCIAGFARQRDRLYILISSAVLAVLLFSLIHRA